MTNMSYCRFRNTLRDLLDCEENIYSTLDSDDERSARLDLIDACIRIARLFDEVDEE